MNTVIFRTITPLIVAVMVIFAVYVTLRGHNEPGGGFIGGLIAAAAMAIFGMSSGPEAVRNALRFEPMAIAGCGVLLAAGAGLVSAFHGAPFLTAFWADLPLGHSAVTFSTPAMFDIGVFLVVFGTISAVLLGLEEHEDTP